MYHDDCDWAVAGECDACGHRTNPSDMIRCDGHDFCDEDCMESWRRERKAAGDGASRPAHEKERAK